ncbi:MAG: FtsX-like permease family protein [Streptosporangiaceae bacterium]|nr:FtsX-like permease family protein [Streptosporangiaceae bacterium]
MGRVFLVGRLAIRDMRRRRTEVIMLLLAITAATATLTLGLALRGVTSNPWARTRAATAGPDVVATTAGMQNQGSAADLRRLAGSPGVTGYSGPYPLASSELRVHRVSVRVNAEGRDTTPVAIDQPDVLEGTWVRDGGAVIERGLAEALGVRPGDQITLSGHSFTVAGIAVTTAQPFYPLATPGLIWVTRPAAAELAATADPLSYVVSLRLADPATAPAFADAHFTSTYWARDWQSIRDRDAATIQVTQTALVAGSSLLGLLAVASIAVLVGGRMTSQTRRVGLLKAVGATPRLVAVILLAEHLLVALAAAALGLAAGRLAAPLLTSPGNGLVGAASSPSLTETTAGLVICMAVGLAIAATLAPAIRGARTSTVRALDEPARPPRRRPRMIALSARLPLPLLLGLRLVARRPGRTRLAAASLAITVATAVATLATRHDFLTHNAERAASGDYVPGLGNPIADRVGQVIGVLTVVLAVLAAVNAVFITWASAHDARRPSALARAFGATPGQVSAGLVAAQLLPALAAAILGIPAGLLLYRLTAQGDSAVFPPLWSLLAVVPGTLIVVAALTALPARTGARYPVAEVLRTD